MPQLPSTVPDLLFAVSAVLVVALSLAVVLARNPVRATLLLILSFLPVALIYILLQASFAGLLQVLVYAGAIMMLFTFVIMMVNPPPGAGEVEEDAGTARKAFRRGDLAALLLLGAIALIVIPPVYTAAARITEPMAASGGSPAHKDGFGTAHSLSQLIFTDPVNNPLTVSFELISILILVGVIAAVNFGRRNARKRATREPLVPPVPPANGRDA